MSQNKVCLICNVTIGPSARNRVNIFTENNILQSGRKICEVISDVVESPILEESAKSSEICRRCQKSCTEYDALKARIQVLKNEITENYKKTIEFDSLVKTINASKTPVKELKNRIVLPASKLHPLPPNYVIEMGKLTGNNMVLPRIESTGTLLNGLFKVHSNLKVATVSSATLTQINKTVVTSSPIKVTADPVPSPVKVTDTSDKDIVTSLMMPTLTQNSIVTKKNPVMSFNVNLPKDFLSSAVMSKSVRDSVKREMKMDAGLDQDTEENNDEQPMEIDEDCSLAVVPLTTDGNGKLVFEGDKIDLKSKTSSSFFDVGLLLEGDGETQNSCRDEKFILDKLQILQDDDDDDDDDGGGGGHAIVMEEDGSGTTYIRVGDGAYELLADDADDAAQQGNESNDESQIELQMSGDEETANAIIAAAQEQGGAFIKVESGEMYRVKSVKQSKTEDDLDASMHLSNIVEALNDGQFKCLLCEKNRDNDNNAISYTSDADAMMAHLKKSHSARLYICQVCGHMVRRRSEYSSHIEEHAQKNKTVVNKSKLHECPVCLKSYNSKTLLGEHMNMHTGTRPYTCAVCNKAFASKYTLQAHMKTHEERPRPFKCGSCGKAFLTQQNLAQHEKTHSGIKEFVCKMCDKAFATQHNLEVHCVVHSGRKPFFCDVCNKCFARRAEVKDHMRIHTGERPFTCEICHATFTQRSNLHSHKRATHFDDKRYHCTHCPKKFKRRRLLDYHIKAAHTGERPLKCETCQATFVYPEHYKKHVRIHSGERPYICEVCGKSFNSRDNRNMHRFVHSDKKPYECLACGAGFMRKQLLYAHMNTTGHVAESIVVNQPKVITAVENIFEATSELELDENDGETAEDDGATKLFITEAVDNKIVLQNKSEINVLQDGEESAFLTLHNFNGLIEANLKEEKLDEQAQIVTTDEKGNTMRLIQVQLPDGKSGWVAINN